MHWFILNESFISVFVFATIFTGHTLFKVIIQYLLYFPCCTIHQSSWQDFCSPTRYWTLGPQQWVLTTGWQRNSLDSLAFWKGWKLSENSNPQKKKILKINWKWEIIFFSVPHSYQCQKDKPCLLSRLAYRQIDLQRVLIFLCC